MKLIHVAAAGLALLIAGVSFALPPRNDGGSKSCWRCSCSADGGCTCWLISGPACS